MALAGFPLVVLFVYFDICTGHFGLILFATFEALMKIRRRRWRSPRLAKRLILRFRPRYVGNMLAMLIVIGLIVMPPPLFYLASHTLPPPFRSCHGRAPILSLCRVS